MHPEELGWTPGPRCGPGLMVLGSTLSPGAPGCLHPHPLSSPGVCAQVPWYVGPGPLQASLISLDLSDSLWLQRPCFQIPSHPEDLGGPGLGGTSPVQVFNIHSCLSASSLFEVRRHHQPGTETVLILQLVMRAGARVVRCQAMQCQPVPPPSAQPATHCQETAS